MKMHYPLGRITAEIYVDLRCWMVGVNFARLGPSVYIHVGPIICGFWTNPPSYPKGKP